MAPHGNRLCLDCSEAENCGCLDWSHFSSGGVAKSLLCSSTGHGGDVWPWWVLICLPNGPPMASRVRWTTCFFLHVIKSSDLTEDCPPGWWPNMEFLGRNFGTEPGRYRRFLVSHRLVRDGQGWYGDDPRNKLVTIVDDGGMLRLYGFVWNVFQSFLLVLSKLGIQHDPTISSYLQPYHMIFKPGKSTIFIHDPFIPGFPARHWTGYPQFIPFQETSILQLSIALTWTTTCCGP